MIAIRRCPGTLHLCANILKRVDTNLGQSSFRKEASESRIIVGPKAGRLTSGASLPTLSDFVLPFVPPQQLMEPTHRL